jgi:hypothetical protein
MNIVLAYTFCVKFTSSRPSCLTGTAGEVMRPTSPIKVARKPKSCSAKRARNVFFDDRGFPDESDDYDNLLHNINGGVILQKKKFPMPSIDSVDPEFNWEYSDKLHKEKLRNDLNLSHLSLEHAAALIAVIKEYWCVFDERGTFVPICNYECIIDTGNAAPIAIKKILYGPREIPIMRKSIDALAKVGQIRQIHDGQWLFNSLTPKSVPAGTKLVLFGRYVLNIYVGIV